MESTIGKRISAHRKKLGMTLDQLGEKLGLTAQAVSKWENDLSCPDITVLPKLADIFGITTDALLGRETEIPACETVVVNIEDSEQNGFTFDNGKVNFHWNGFRLEGIRLACWVLLTDTVYLIAQLMKIEVSFWNVLWPAFLLALGIFGLYPRFSVFRFGCALVGGYFLADKLLILKYQLNSGVLFAVLILLFGLSLLLDALRKHNCKGGNSNLQAGNVFHKKVCNEYNVAANTFTYDACFGDTLQRVELAVLKSGHISTIFGNYTIDLSGIENLEGNCNLHADCSFGELTILVPRRFSVQPDSSTSFADFEIQGLPDPVPIGNIMLIADVSFSCIYVRFQQIYLAGFFILT